MRRLGGLSWAILAVSGALGAFSLGLLALDVVRGGTPGASAVGQAVFIAVFVPFGVVGALVASRRPENPIGWLFLAMASMEWVRTLAGNYLSLGTDLPMDGVARWAGILLDQPGPGLAMMVFLLFPTGTFLSPLWRRTGQVLIVWMSLSVLLPASVELAGPGLSATLAAADEMRVLSTPVMLIGAVLGLVTRYRRGTGTVRQQMKWLVASAAALALAFVATSLVFATGQDPEGPLARSVFFVVFVPSVASVPVAIGVAILRYRLYEIDRILNRALVYGAVTALLVSLYAGMVVALQPVLRPLTGSSDLAVAASTLAVAGAFGPVRRRVQESVDRRFSRARYDARMAVEALAHRLRQGVDLDDVSVALLATAKTTLQPSQAALWLPEHRPLALDPR